MFLSLLGWTKSLFKTATYQNSLDAYIASKHPTSAAEVDHWIRTYDQQYRSF